MNSIIKNNRMYFYYSPSEDCYFAFRVIKDDSGFMMIFCDGSISKIDTTFTIPFPISFASDCLCVTQTIPDLYGVAYCGSGGTDSFTVVARDRWGDFEEGYNIDANIIAIGRWK